MNEFKTDKLNECICGFKPDCYFVGYSSTPYDVFCPNCKKQTQFAKCQVTGSVNNLIDYWNKHISKLTLQEMEKEVSDLREERKKADPFNQECEVYEYYWVKGEGEVLHTKCK